MRHLGVSLGLICIALITQGCATNTRLQQIKADQIDVHEFLQEQSEQLIAQQEQLSALKADRQRLLARIDGLEIELQTFKSKTEQTAPQEQLIGAADNTSTESAEQRRESAFGKVVLGRIEWVWFDLFNRSVQTRIDTKVKSSVIYASRIQQFERDGEEWVRFVYRFNEVAGDGGEETNEKVPMTMEAPVVKKIRIKNGSEQRDKYPVVRLRIKVGELVDDSLFVVKSAEGAHSITVGRTFLRDIAVVDSSQTFTQPKPGE